MNELKNKIKLFEEKQVRHVWDEGSELLTNCQQLKLLATNGSQAYEKIVQLTTNCSQLKLPTTRHLRIAESKKGDSDA